VVLTATESPGVACPAGGVRFVVGTDANRNGSLDDAEIDSSLTRLVCNGVQGPKGDTGTQGDKGDTGTAGASGLSTLVANSDEPVGGGNCVAGGTRMEAGLDANRNGTLDEGELNVSLTRFVCNGQHGLNGLKGDKGDAGPQGEKGDPGVMYVRTKVVSPGTTPATSGTALRAAIDSIADGKTWLVKVEPGVYDLGSLPLQLRPGIHLQGSGENSTLVRASISSTSVGTVMGTANSELSSLTVENIGGGSDSIAIYSEAPSFTFHDIVATARGGSAASFGIVLKKAQGSFSNVRAIASSSGYASGFQCFSCTANLLESYAEANGDTLTASTQAMGIYTSNGTVYLRNVTSNANGAHFNWGVYADGNVSLVNVEAQGSGGTKGIGLFVGEGNGNVRNSVLTGTSPTESQGISSSTSGTTTRFITVQNSIVTGGFASIWRAQYFDVRIGQSQLNGPPLPGAGDTTGKYTCFGNYDGNFGPVSCL
jgi:hypothetical protein